MKKLRTMLVAAVAAMAIVCAFALTACGDGFPDSYELTGTITSTMSQGTADAVLELKADNTLVLEAKMTGDVVIGRWTGTWKQNKDGTVTIAFASKDSSGHSADAPMHLELNDNPVDDDAVPGMGGLTVTTAIKDGVNSFELKTIFMAGTYPLPFECPMTQTVSAQ